MDTLSLDDSILCIIAIGDFGRGDNGQKAVAGQMALYSQTNLVDMVIL